MASKNIFENFDYDEYHNLLDSALAEDIHLVHNNEGMGGFSFAWQRATEFAKGRMVWVSVAFCSPKDQFCRKIGAFHALDNFINKGHIILLPVGDEDAGVIVARIRHTFSKTNPCFWY
jgi:hypothetical protein